MTDQSQPDDPLIPGGPTMAELRDAGVERLLEPFRAELSIIQGSIVKQLADAVAIVRALGENDWDYDDPRTNRPACPFCAAYEMHPAVVNGPKDHLPHCLHRQAAEWFERSGGR